MPDKVHFHFSVCIVELSQEGGQKSLDVLLIPGGPELLVPWSKNGPNRRQLNPQSEWKSCFVDHFGN